MALFIEGEKYACASCIRGHRVKKCNHKDRELFPLLKRGRQISQCTHCRDLRKTNQAHVKCTCAISSAPNPINGCLCEVILTCNCVAQHLQDVQTEESINSDSTTIAPLVDFTNNTSYNQTERHTSDTSNKQLSIDNDLFSFLTNDLDKYLYQKAGQ